MSFSLCKVSSNAAGRWPGNNVQTLRKPLSDSASVEKPGGSPIAFTLDHYDALRALGYMYLQTGQRHKALSLFEALHHLLPDDHLIALSLIYCRQALGHYQAALDLAESLLVETPENLPLVPLNLLCARALHGLGKNSDARLQLLRYQEAKGNLT